MVDATDDPNLAARICRLVNAYTVVDRDAVVGVPVDHEYRKADGQDCLLRNELAQVYAEQDIGK